MPAKKLTYSEDARKSLRAGIDTLADSVKVTLWSQGHLDGISEGINTGTKRLTCFLRVNKLFWGHPNPPL